MQVSTALAQSEAVRLELSKLLAQTAPTPTPPEQPQEIPQPAPPEVPQPDPAPPAGSPPPQD